MCASTSSWFRMPYSHFRLFDYQSGSTSRESRGIRGITFSRARYPCGFGQYFYCYPYSRYFQSNLGSHSSAWCRRCSGSRRNALSAPY